MATKKRTPKQDARLAGSPMSDQTTSTQTCLDCKVLPPFSVILCPMHAAANDMRALLSTLAARETDDPLVHDSAALLDLIEEGHS